jgi:hypothetical protein
LSLYGAALCCFSAIAVNALPETLSERAEAFATCSGRLSALAVHGRSHDRFRGDAIDRLAQEFDLLLDSLPPAAAGDARRSLHGTGWGEVAWLLNEVFYSLDAARAERASRHLRRKIVNCTTMLIPGAPPSWALELTAPADAPLNSKIGAPTNERLLP